MNKYQRKKVKRMKKLASLGVSYSCQKYIMRKYNFAQIDRMIEQLNKIKNSGILDWIQRVARQVSKAFMKFKNNSSSSIR